nr:MAG TPA: hypothetical protein [Caudoviricetes sp.]
MSFLWLVWLKDCHYSERFNFCGLWVVFVAFLFTGEP